MSKPNRALAFLGFGKSKAEQKKEDELAERQADETKAKVDDEDEEDEEDKEDDTEEAKAAKAQRNGLRAAGERRGRRLERERIGAIMSGVEPAKAELALHFAVNTDMSAEQAKASLDKAPAAAARTPFADAMREHGHGGQAPAGGSSSSRGPGFGADNGTNKGPRLVDGMAKLIEQKGWKK